MNKELIVAIIISLVIHIGIILFPSGRTKTEVEVTKGLSSLDVIVVTAESPSRLSPHPTLPQRDVGGGKKGAGEAKPITGHHDTLVADASPRLQTGDSHLEEAEKPLLNHSHDSEKKDVPDESLNYLRDKGSLTSAKPKYLQNPAPLYPLAARKNGYEGTTILNVKVMPDGTAGEVKVFKSSNYEILDKAAVEAVEDWKFIPAKRLGIPIVKWVTIPIRFQLEEWEEKN